MKISVVKSPSMKVEAVLVPILKDQNLKANLCEFQAEIIEKYVEAKVFEGKSGEVYKFSRVTDEGVMHTVLIGLGEKDNLKSQDAFEAVAKGVQEAQALKAKSLRLSLDNVQEVICEEMLSRIIIGAGLAEYKYDVFKTGDKITDIDTLEIVVDNKDSEAILNEAQIIIESTIIARDLVNMPANVLKPTELSLLAEKYGKEFGFEVSVLGKEEIKALKMEAFLAVSQGSDSEPKLIVMRYNGGEDKEKLAIVGKGLTYDSGGYSIKPSESMDTMKTDMGGSAAAIGAMCAIAKAKLPVNVVGIVAACENMISGHAILPGDIVGSMCGKTIEVHNTDAEGRLTLIDAVHYAVTKENCTKVVDLATLTGAVVVALGDHYAGLLGNDDEMIEAMKVASSKSGDAVWQMPYTEAVAKRNKSQIADLINSGKRGLGCSVGGAFVAEGVDGKPWVHVDIAGVADFDDNRSYCRNGGSGFGVNLMYQFVKDMK